MQNFGGQIKSIMVFSEVAYCSGSLLVAFSIIVSYFNNCMQYLLLYGSFSLSGQPLMNFVF